MSIDLNTGIAIQTDQNLFNYDTIKLLLQQMTNPDNFIRAQCEEKLFSFKYNIEFFNVLFSIFTNANEEKYFKLQSIILLKNILRMEIDSNKMKFRSINNVENGQPQNDMKNFLTIIEGMKKQMISIISNNEIDSTYYNHIKEIFLTISDKYFPGNWDDLNILFFKTFEVKFAELVKTGNLDVNFLLKINDLCYSILKQHNKKRLPSTRSKFLQFKKNYIEMCYTYYMNIHNFFKENSINLNDINLFVLFLNLLMSADKLILIIVECSFSINEFHKDEQLLNILKLILQKIDSLLDELYKNNVDEIKFVLKKNLYKIIKLLTRIQSGASILFYRDLEHYVNILIKIIENFQLFDKEIIKVSIFGLYRVMNTVSYKELNQEYLNSKFRSGSIRDGIDDENYKLEKKHSFNQGKTNSNIGNISLTPDKNRNTKNKAGISILVSPTKFKNYESELNHANQIYYNCFSDENIKHLIDILITKIPFCEFNKFESESTESDNMAELEDEIYSNDTFSNNVMSWSYLYKSLLQSLLVNFSNISLKYIRDSIDFFNQNLNNDQYTGLDNVFILRSIIYFTNIVPIEYKKGVILEYDMIDFKLFFDLLEKLICKSDLILKDYIVSISRWSEVLISEEIFYKYIDNLYFFLNTSKNNTILLESCLSLKNLINQIDKLIKGSSELNIYIDKKKLEQNLKSKINWALLLERVCSVSMNLIPFIKSSETILSLINLFTGLLNKCHFQCDGKILDIINNSQLIQIIDSMNDEFSQNAFIDMWKTLILSFPGSEILMRYSLSFVSKSLKREIETHNLQLLLFIIRVCEETPEIRALLKIFLEEHIEMFQTSNKQYISTILFNILEELAMFNIFDLNDAKNIFDMALQKYIKAYEMTKEATNKYILENNQNKKTESSSNVYSGAKGRSDVNYVFCDISEFKASILSLLNTFYMLFYNYQNVSLPKMFYKDIIKIILDETVISGKAPHSYFSVLYLSNSIPLLNRICVQDFECFIAILNEYLSENNLSFKNFLEVWLSKMEQMISVEARKLNVITLCKLIPIMDKDIFLFYINNIFHICLVTVHADMMKKLERDVLKNEFPVQNTIKNMNVKQSERKRLLSLNDYLNKIDVHLLFVENINNALRNCDMTLNDFIKLFSHNLPLVNKLNHIFGLEESDY